jgi:hypothetical protein
MTQSFLEFGKRKQATAPGADGELQPRRGVQKIKIIEPTQSDNGSRGAKPWHLI